MQKKHLHLFIGLIIIILSLFYAFKGVKLSELKDAFLTVRYVYLIPALVLILSSYWLRAVRWRYLVCSVKKDVKTAELYSPMMVGYMANMLPARAGEFVRAYLLSKRTGINLSSSFATIFIERLFDLMVVLVLIAWVLFFMSDIVTANNSSSANDILEKVRIFGTLTFVLCLFILLFSALLQFRNEWAMAIVGFFLKPLPKHWGEKIIAMVHSFTEGLSIIKDKRGFMATVILSFLIWGIFVVTYYPLYLAFDIQAHLPVVSSLVFLCLAVAVFITIMPTPGFLGSYQLGCVAALHGMFGISKPVALSYGIVAWIMGMGATVVIGAVYAMKDHVSIGEISAGKEMAE